LRPNQPPIKKTERGKSFSITFDVREETMTRQDHLDAQLVELRGRNEDLEKQLSQMKAKHFDKLDLIKRAADLEARITFITAEKDVAIKERNRLELDLSKLKREKQ
jgi:BMFP domain-containing protein YqiC